MARVFQVEGIARAPEEKEINTGVVCRQIKAYIRHRLGRISRTRSRECQCLERDGEPWKSFRRRVDTIPLMFPEGSTLAAGVWMMTASRRVKQGLVGIENIWTCPRENTSGSFIDSLVNDFQLVLQWRKPGT